MDLKFEIYAFIAKPVESVYEAVADPAQLSSYFTTGGASARLNSGETVRWAFKNFPNGFPVEVLEAQPHKKIVIRWAADDPDKNPYDTTTTFLFEPAEGGRTKITLTEDGWRHDKAGLKASYNNCFGWTQMLCAMKAWLEHGINLREGMFN